MTHFHGIFLLRDYPLWQLTANFLFWGEHYLVHGFLAFNESFRVPYSTVSQILSRPGGLQQAFPRYLYAAAGSNSRIQEVT